MKDLPKRLTLCGALALVMALLLAACNIANTPSLASLLKLDPTRPTFVYFYTPG